MTCDAALFFYAETLHILNSDIFGGKVYPSSTRNSKQPPRKRCSQCCNQQNQPTDPALTPHASASIAYNGDMQEYARCRRLNVTLSSALGTRACDTLEGDYYSSRGSDRPTTSSGGGGIGGGSVGGGWLPLPPPPALLPRTSGLLRRLPSLPSALSSSGVAAAAKHASDQARFGSRSPSPTFLPPHPPPLVTPKTAAESMTVVAAAGGDGQGSRGSGDGRSSGTPGPAGGENGDLLGAMEVKRALRFCMKVHRFRETCRPGSCVAFRRVRRK